MTLDKWQEREAAQYARDNGVTEAEAVGALFPAEVAEAPAAEVVNPAEYAPDGGNAPDAGEVSTTK